MRSHEQREATRALRADRKAARRTGSRPLLVPAREHDTDCLERLARACTTPIECEHGYDVCPKCDPCTCEPSTTLAIFDPKGGAE